MLESRRKPRRRLGCALVELWLIALLASLYLAPPAAATEYEKHAHGLAVYLGVLPAELLRGKASDDALRGGEHGSDLASARRNQLFTAAS